MARLPVKKKKKENLTVKRLLRLTETLDEQTQKAAEAQGLPVMHWIRVAMIEKLKREGVIT